MEPDTLQKKALNKYPQSNIMEDFGEVSDNNEAARLAYLEGCRDAIKLVSEKVQDLIKRYGSIKTKDSYSKIFQGARLMGYEDIDTFINKIEL